MEPSSQFWRYIDEVVASHTIVIDRPKGSSHPDYPDIIYPVDYGYLEGTLAMDGGGIDVWVGSSGLAQVDGVICTANVAKLDVEIKVLLSCTDDEMEAILALMNSGSQAGLLVRR